jgi:PAS domain S-box-containing protein
MPESMLDPLSVAVASVSDAAQDRGGSADSLAELVDVAVEPTVEVALRAVREMLGMEVAYMSEIIGGEMAVCKLDGDGESFGLAKGLSMAREQTYCQRMLDGRIPNLIPDVRADDRTAALPVTRAGNVGAFATVPLTFTDGRLYGTLCAASHDAKSLDHRELQFLKVFARLIADQLERQQAVVAVSQLAALVNAADDAILGLTPAGLVTSWNAASERMFGYLASEAIGHSIVDLIALPGGEDGMRRALARVTAGEVVHREGRRRRADGSVVYDAVTLSPIRDGRGDVSFISAVSRDISDAVFQAHYREVEREVVSSLAGASDAADATLEMLRGVGQGLDCEIGALWEIDETAEKLRCSSLWTSEPQGGDIRSEPQRGLV